MKKTMNRPTWRKGEEKWGSCVEGDIAGIMTGDTRPPHWGRDTPKGMGAHGASHTRAEEQ